MTEESAKLIFIRQSATEAYAKGEIENATTNLIREIVPIMTVASMSKEETGSHIYNLEKARAYLAAFTQGVVIGYQTELTPIFKERERKRREEKLKEKITNAKDKKVNDLISLARDLASKGSIVNPPPVINTVTKITCPKCSKETFSLKFHKC